MSTDFCKELDKNGDQEGLRFPPFHEEILRHTHWDAGEMYGRIRIVVAEGFARPNRSPPFERVRDIVIFSFQHAPLRMWLQGPRPFLQYSLGHEKAALKDEDAHSHSPTHHEGRSTMGNVGPNQAVLPYRFQPTAAMPWQHNPWPEGDPGWVVPAPPFLDPFVDPYRYRGNNRSTLDDVSMPDYVASSANSSRAISTNFSLGRNQEPSAPAPIDDEQYNQLIEALSPKKGASGTCAPANTPVSTAPKKTKLSPAAEPRVKAARSRQLKERSQAGSSRLPSGSSAFSDTSSGGKIPSRLLSPSPNAMGKEKSRSPASSGDSSPSSGTHLKPTLQIPVSSDSKRKRPLRSNKKSMDSIHSVSPSPSKKVSRRKEPKSVEKEKSVDLPVVRASKTLISDVE
ncbi:hypothetical protein PRK78_005347 [Emydomyces testavorans]|uniref:Uncharacterized protein n=1 Tax=Emydomyces testavorans TaxID=2070801 RepID=A0AAF0DJF7_9EURO|nr:hypothetical protein PRK78_005347 [Emydomyces testavorans]